MIALGTVLANIKIFEMPNGGSITLLSMLPFYPDFPSATAWKWGLFTGFVNSLLQMLLGFYAPPAPGILPLVGMILLDYVLAFTLLGLACVIAKPFQNRLVGVAVGTAVVCFIRFMCSFLSGVLIWGQPERQSARLDVQPDLQRRLHAAGDHPDDDCGRADLQGSPPAVRRAGKVRYDKKFPARKILRTGIFIPVYGINNS